MDAETGLISPGGIGFDINCGMRLVVTQLTYSEVKPRLRELIDALFKRIPAGVGSTGFLSISRTTFQVRRDEMRRDHGVCQPAGDSAPRARSL